MITTAQQTAAIEQQSLDQRKAAARELFWSMGANEARRVKEVLSIESAAEFARIIAGDKATFRIVRFFACLGFDETENNCWEESVGIDEDPQAANAEGGADGLD